MFFGAVAFAECAFAEAPPGGGGGSGGWRRWLAQICNDQLSLNRQPDNALIREVINHMLCECRELFPEAPQSNEELLALLREARVDDDPELIRSLIGHLEDYQSLIVSLPIDGDDSDEELEAILFASIH